MLGKAFPCRFALTRAGYSRVAGALAVLIPIFPASATLPSTVIPTHYDVVLQPDGKNLTFSGREKINLSVRAATEEIVLNAWQLNVKRVELKTEGGKSLGAARVRLDPTNQTMHISVGSRVAAGRYILSIAYSGTVQRSGSGLFALDEQGKRYLFTQLEAADARRLIPSWDEPSFKATFTVKALVPSGATAISNMPAVKDVRVRDGRHQVTFAPTPKMATYLLFLAVGDFERTTKKIDGVELGVVTRRGVGSQADFALDSATRLLPWLNAYFAYPFPLPKLDNVAGPGESLTYGAMENWGAVFSFERDFLLDPRTASERRKQGVFTTLAHEMAHQWFGDLVTMRWWDDLWLNEGFASWMEQEADRHFHPEWSPDLTFMRGRDLAMEADALDTSHAVVQPVNDAAGALQSFDFITYFKGEAAIRMLEAYVGSEAWRAGLRDYIARHAYGSTTSDDLWASVSAAAKLPVDGIARDITRQAGLPLVEASSSCESGQTIVRLDERRFHSDGRDDPGPGWHLPVLLGHPGQKPQQLLLHDKAMVSIPGCGATVVNIGQKSYFRTAYSPSMLAELSKVFPSLDQIDQLALLSDTAALGLAGAGSPAAILELTSNLGPEAPAPVVSDALSHWDTLYGYAANDARGQLLLRDFAQASFAPRLQMLGWSPRSGEPAEDANLREQLIETLGGAGVPEVLNSARHLFEANEEPAPRIAVLKAVARNASAEDWERIRIMAFAERSPQLRSSLFELLGRARDDALAAKALDIAVADTSAGTAGPRMIEAVAISHPLMAFRFALAHRDIILKQLDSFTAATFLADLAGRSGDTEILDAVRAYCAEQQSHEIQDACATTTTLLKNEGRIRAARMPGVFSWLDAQERKSSPSR
ncbi:aminopeptidase [Sphingobium amiense]|uniref:Aminopeptidase n=1 Tax=Sphingobium amiense TaxID=135719 RepID=A0A494VX30_9SPHN|nr:M1 family metallopeptidase [Sphingobium amiense]BBD96953.1 aminopeptidase [Sphingobium amiense]